MDDAQIVELYLSRDESAISETAAKYGQRLRLIAERILGDAPAAEECENETYLKAWGLIPPNEPRTYLFAFLGRITRHLAIDEYRKKLPRAGGSYANLPTRWQSASLLPDALRRALKQVIWPAALTPFSGPAPSSSDAFL